MLSHAFDLELASELLERYRAEAERDRTLHATDPAPGAPPAAPARAAQRGAGSDCPHCGACPCAAHAAQGPI
jgi:hypothetical protein